MSNFWKFCFCIFIATLIVILAIAKVIVDNPFGVICEGVFFYAIGGAFLFSKDNQGREYESV